MIFYYLLIGVVLALLAHVILRWAKKQNERDQQAYKQWATYGSIAGIILVLLRSGALRSSAWASLLAVLLPFLASAQSKKGAPPFPPPPSRDPAREEAAKILGVSADATPEDIEKAYRRAIQRVHPDAGGSHYLAAQVNLARETLLKKAK